MGDGETYTTTLCMLNLSSTYLQLREWWFHLESLHVCHCFEQRKSDIIKPKESVHYNFHIVHFLGTNGKGGITTYFHKCLIGFKCHRGQDSGVFCSIIYNQLKDGAYHIGVECTLLSK